MMPMGKLRHEPFLARFRVEQIETADSVFVRHECDRLAVARDDEVVNVPLDVVCQIGVLLGGEVDVSEALKL